MNAFDQSAPIFLLCAGEELHLQSADAPPKIWRRADVILWILTLRGSACYSQSGRPQFLLPGTVLVSPGPLNRSIKVNAKDGGWHCVYLAAENEMTKSRMEYVMRNFGSMTKTALDSSCVRLARRLVSRRSRKDLWTQSSEAFRWFHAWWQESERHNLEIRHLLSSKAEPQECAQEIFSLKSLASQLGYSPSYLSRMLGKKWRKSPARSLREALAAKLGYLSDSAFIRAFRKVHGISPDKYRARHRKSSAEGRPPA
jgi:AraC-like DNA-binding protein